MADVSIVIPMYNVGAYISECLTSLQRQTFQSFEAVCIDDGSTDDTLAIARKTVGDDDRFSFVSQENAGAIGCAQCRHRALDGEVPPVSRCRRLLREPDPRGAA